MMRPEQKLHLAVAAYFRATMPANVLWLHVPNGGGRSKTEAGILKGMGVRPGVADFLIVACGRAYFIELKAAKGSASPAQKVFRADCEMQGVPYAECRSLAEVEGTLAGWSIKPRGRIAA